MLDFTQIVPIQGVITFPELVIPAQPKQPEQILETVVLRGSSILDSSLGASVDSPE